MPQGPTDSPPPPGAGLPTRRCSRCRQMFDGDPAAPVSPFAEWWLCEGCHRILLPRQPQAAAGFAPAVVPD